MTAFNELTAAEAARAIAEGRITSEALVRACLERIEAREETVHAWVAVDPDLAIAQARAADANPTGGPIHGLPVGIKDIIDTADLPTRHGSSIYAENRPSGDAACVAMIRRAGGVILGKTVTTEFAYLTPRETRNPHDPSRTPGGSSSGSAAAVADQMVPLAYGTQTAGSVIRPASFCGVVAYKGSFGALPMAGIKPFAPLLDTLGIFARRVADAALLRSALTGAPAEPLAMTKPPRIALFRAHEWDQADAACHDAVEGTAHRLAQAGAEVADVAPPDAFADLVTAQMTVLSYEGARSYASEYLRAPELLSDGIRGEIENGLAIPYADYVAAWNVAGHCQGLMRGILEDHDCLLAPSAVGEAPVGEPTGDPVFNRVWTFLHAACLTLPAARGPNGMPIGVQAIAQVGEDDHLLGVGQWMEAALISN